ncbi:13593_t:CDS:2 [Dentiscutata heterogama]|uniref:13593_t:CDS:1 n=1 Tax=Dentiscutata heterogama TaxID=1316150 RepID=A0ACA9MNL5_9GLOM|nr:13593_t:CDS:2 [Dentiscutata heterogama]
MQKLPAILESLDGDTKKYVMEWADIVRAKHSSDNDFDSDDDNNPIYYGDPLLIIEWNETGLAQRNIQKNIVLTYIRSFQGCNPFPGSGQPQSNSLFYIVNTPGIRAQQTICNIIYGLQRMYAQRNVPSLGRIYSVVAEKKNTFEAAEILGAFAL